MTLNGFENWQTLSDKLLVTFKKYLFCDMGTDAENTKNVNFIHELNDSLKCYNLIAKFQANEAKDSDNFNKPDITVCDEKNGNILFVIECKNSLESLDKSVQQINRYKQCYSYLIVFTYSLGIQLYQNGVQVYNYYKRDYNDLFGQLQQCLNDNVLLMYFNDCVDSFVGNYQVELQKQIDKVCAILKNHRNDKLNCLLMQLGYGNFQCKIKQIAKIIVCSINHCSKFEWFNNENKDYVKFQLISYLQNDFDNLYFAQVLYSVLVDKTVSSYFDFLLNQKNVLKNVGLFVDCKAAKVNKLLFDFVFEQIAQDYRLDIDCCNIIADEYYKELGCRTITDDIIEYINNEAVYFDWLASNDENDYNCSNNNGRRILGNMSVIALSAFDINKTNFLKQDLNSYLIEWSGDYIKNNKEKSAFYNHASFKLGKIIQNSICGQIYIIATHSTLLQCNANNTQNGYNVFLEQIKNNASFCYVFNFHGGSVRRGIINQDQPISNKLKTNISYIVFQKSNSKCQIKKYDFIGSYQDKINLLSTIKCDDFKIQKSVRGYEYVLDLFEVPVGNHSPAHYPMKTDNDQGLVSIDKKDGIQKILKYQSDYQEFKKNNKGNISYKDFCKLNPYDTQNVLVKVQYYIGDYRWVIFPMASQPRLRFLPYTKGLHLTVMPTKEFECGYSVIDTSHSVTYASMNTDIVRTCSIDLLKEEKIQQYRVKFGCEITKEQFFAAIIGSDSKESFSNGSVIRKFRNLQQFRSKQNKGMRIIKANQTIVRIQHISFDDNFGVFCKPYVIDDRLYLNDNNFIDNCSQEIFDCKMLKMTPIKHYIDERIGQNIQKQDIVALKSLIAKINAYSDRQVQCIEYDFVNKHKYFDRLF